MGINPHACRFVFFIYLSILLFHCFYETAIRWNIRAICIIPASFAATALSAAP